MRIIILLQTITKNCEKYQPER